MNTPGDELVTVAWFDTQLEAHLALGRLRAEGIDCQLMDEHLVQMDWLYSVAVGGIKLRVALRDVRLAESVLQNDYSKELD